MPGMPGMGGGGEEAPRPSKQRKGRPSGQPRQAGRARSGPPPRSPPPTVPRQRCSVPVPAGAGDGARPADARPRRPAPKGFEKFLGRWLQRPRPGGAVRGFLGRTPRLGSGDERPVLHLRGPVLVGPEDGRPSLGRRRPGHLRARSLAADGADGRGWVLPGLVDAHCHVGLDAHGAVDRDDRRGAGADRPRRRDAADPRLPARRPTPAGSTTARTCRAIIRAGRHIARTRRYIRNFAHEVEPEQLADAGAAARPAPATAGSSWSATGSTARSATSPRCWPRRRARARPSPPRTSEGARVTAHCFGEESLRDLVARGHRLHRARHRPAARHHRRVRGRRASPSSRPWSTSTPSRRSPTPAREKFPDYAGTCATCTPGGTRPSRAAHEAGIPIYVGTDAGGSLPHGLVAAEVAQLAQAGLTAAEALDAASWGARAWLGWPGLEEGEEADLRRLPRRPARGHRRAGAPSPSRAPRPHPRLIRPIGGAPGFSWRMF